MIKNDPNILCQPTKYYVNLRQERADIMYVKSLELKNFRNYDSLCVSFDQKTNIFYGDNAQGKTNILEAVYLCGTTKSHRSSKDREMIQFNKDEAHIRMQISKAEVVHRIDMHLKKKTNQKELQLMVFQYAKLQICLASLILCFFLRKI